jgi:outer membrane protein OmpA-like peptidoglycan-associated protein
VRALPLALLLAGCGSQAPAPAPEPTQSVPAPPAPRERQIGTVSGLSGQTSALTGAVSDFAVERTATETRVLLAADTLFAFDQATLTLEAQANLTRTAEVVRQGGMGEVRVVGYTDAKGDDAYNDRLSRARADAVASWLRQQPELSERAFAAEGRGERDPVAPNATPDGSDDPAGRSKNRRVVVVVPNRTTAAVG